MKVSLPINVKHIFGIFQGNVLHALCGTLIALRGWNKIARNEENWDKWTPFERAILAMPMPFGKTYLCGNWRRHSHFFFRGCCLFVLMRTNNLIAISGGRGANETRYGFPSRNVEYFSFHYSFSLYFFSSFENGWARCRREADKRKAWVIYNNRFGGHDEWRQNGMSINKQPAVTADLYFGKPILFAPYFQHAHTHTDVS